MQKSRNNSNVRRVKFPSGNNKRVEEHPPQINGYELDHKKTLRFTVIAAVTNQAITQSNLLDLILIATTATAGTQLFDIVKVRSVSIWAAAALGTPTTVAVTFTSVNQAGDDTVHTDTSLGVKPAYVRASPSPKSLASFFQLGGATVAFTLTAPAGSIIDVSLTYKTSAAAPVAVTNALVAATAGELYWRGLDGVAVATTNFPVPNGIPTR